MPKKVAPMNRSISINTTEEARLAQKLISIDSRVKKTQIVNKTINQDLFEILNYLPKKFIDLLFIDPPYNLTKKFNKVNFKEKSISEYSAWLDSFISSLLPCLKSDASIYVCGDWKSSTSIHHILNKYFFVRNRITWEREKGRGAKHNWKNNTEDIWFCTMASDFTFNADAVKLKRKVLAPYKDEKGKPKDWQSSGDGNFRLTFPSNIWTDISVPFWSMSENTDHPTQKPEKLLAKIILASSNEGDLVFDPFLGSGTTSVVAKKLNRNFVGVEVDKYYACLAEKRLEDCEFDQSIQGFHDGVFWERNTTPRK